MSVLSFPRVYINGWMCWNVPTANNNDYIPTYAAEVAELNYPYLSSQFQVGVDTSLADVRQWATSLQYNVSSGSTTANAMIPAEWNYFGDNGASFVDYQAYKTQVSGGETEFGKTVSTDPLIGQKIQLIGNPFGDATQWSPPRLVDNNPVATWTSQIFFDRLIIGDPNATLGLNGSGYSRVHDRLLNFSHRQGMRSAGVASVVWQSGFLKDQIQISGETLSPLLQSLKNAMAAPSAQGLMFRFCTFSTLYFMNDLLNDYPNFYTEDAQKLNKIQAEYYQKALKSGVQFYCPAYSFVVGTVGVWQNNELATAPQGRILMPVSTKAQAKTNAKTNAITSWERAEVITQAATVSGSGEKAAKPYVLGVAIAELYQNSDGSGRLSIDMSSSVPNTTLPAADAYNRDAWLNNSNPDLGPLVIFTNNGSRDETLAVVNFTPVSLGDPAYDWNHYQAKSGILDIPLTKSQVDRVRSETIGIRCQVPESPAYTLEILENPYQIETDQRNEYLEAGDETTISLTVLHQGLPKAGVQVAIVQNLAVNFLLSITAVDEAPVAFAEVPTATVAIAGAATAGDPTGSAVVGDPAAEPPLPPIDTVLIPQPRTVVAFVKTDASGKASFKVRGLAAGFVTLVYSVFDGTPQDFRPSPQETDGISSNNTYFSNIRILPADADMPQEFCDLWNGSYDQALAWQYVYRRILMVYDVLFPSMMQYMPFSNQAAVTAAAGQLVRMIDKSLVERSTLYMPITRDLSAGKRQVLQLWCGLALRNFPPNQPITP